eukprot:scaffold85315_cov30-Phaeocystis_antarctica.AAC.1
MDTPRDAMSSEGDDSPWSARKAAEEAVAARRERRARLPRRWRRGRTPREGGEPTRAGGG